MVPLPPSVNWPVAVLGIPLPSAMCITTFVIVTDTLAPLIAVILAVPEMAFARNGALQTGGLCGGWNGRSAWFRRGSSSGAAKGGEVDRLGFAARSERESAERGLRWQRAAKDKRSGHIILRDFPTHVDGRRRRERAINRIIAAVPFERNDGFTSTGVTRIG